ncbi:hypothetical protein Dimus_039194 [Dionaea muscipula]
MRKMLRSMPNPWMYKVTAIQEAKDLKTLSLEELIGNLITHKLMVSSRIEAPRRDKGLALKARESEDKTSELDDEEFVKNKKVPEILQVCKRSNRSMLIEVNLHQKIRTLLMVALSAKKHITYSKNVHFGTRTVRRTISETSPRSNTT